MFNSLEITTHCLLLFITEPNMSLAKYSKPLSLLAKIALMLAAFWFVLHGVDKAELEEMLRLQNRSAFMEASAFFFMQMIFGAVRWRVVMIALAGVGVRIMSCLSALKIFYISVFFNCCLPGTVGGDVIRVWLIKSEHVSLPLAISSVVIDRMIALLALGVMGGLTLPFLAGYIDVSLWVLMPVFLLLAVFGFWVLFNIDKLVLLFPALKKLHWLEHLLQSIRMITRRPKTALCSLFYAIIAHASWCFAAYVLAESLGNPITLLETITLIPWVLLISIIPLSIGGWGLREAAMIFFLGLAGVPQVAALTLSVQLGLLSIILSLPAGVLWLVNRRQITK